MVTLAPDIASVRNDMGCEMLQAVGLDLSGPSFREALLSRHIETFIIGGVRGGKTTCGDAKIKEDANWHAFVGDSKERLYWVVAAQYELCHQEMEYFHRWAEMDGSCRITRWNHPAEGQWTLQYDQLTTAGHLMRVTIETKSAEKDEGLASVAPDGILVAEAGQCPPSVRSRVLERASEKGAFIVYQGTLEDDSLKPQYAWYVEESQGAKDERTSSRGGYSLPSWENRALYGDCNKQLAANPLYAEWCPDENHGTGHSGLQHPVFRHLRSVLPADEFRRRYGGEPVGLQFAIYKGLDELVLPCPNERMIGAYGGIDYGTVHPTALVACTLQYDPMDATAPPDAPRGIIWVREVRFNDSADPGDTVWLARNKRELQERWHIRQWGVDPNERFMARSQNMERGQIVDAVRVDDGSRNMRIAATKTRISMGKLKFDEAGAGVRELVEEMKQVHRFKTRSGELKLKRDLDDRTAALEDAIEIADGLRKMEIPGPRKVTFGSGRRRSYQKSRRV